MWENIGDGRGVCNYYIMLSISGQDHLHSPHTASGVVRGCETIYLQLVDILDFIWNIRNIVIGNKSMFDNYKNYNKES